MRWGVRSEAEDDHMTTELCLKELTACQKLSTGPNFIVSGYDKFNINTKADSRDWSHDPLITERML